MPEQAWTHTAKVTVHSIIHQIPMRKPGSVKKEKTERDREIDLESRPPFYTCPPTEIPCQKCSFAIPKAQAPLWIREQRMESKWMRELQKERSSRGRAPPSCVAWPPTSKTPSLDSATTTTPLKQETKTERCPLSPQIWHLQRHLDVRSSQHHFAPRPSTTGQDE